MSSFRPRVGRSAADLPMVCDAWLADGRRFGEDLAGLEADSVVGRWPVELETDAVVRLVETVGDEAPWDELASTPPVAQQLDERAQLQPLDREILLHLRHVQHICYKPRLHLRVEEERLPVSRARRVPVRAVADLVSHPGDWEHRTLRSIQPSRVLARQIEDEWNLYENRVAVRLVDHLLAYLARRLEELRKIEEALTTGRDHSDEARTSFWRARRVMTLWSDTLTSKTEDELRETMKRLDLAQRDLQALLGSPLYQNVPQRASVPLSLKPTNIMVNDPHYRKVAALWRKWVKYGHRRHETKQQRAERRQREAVAWDRFVLHLVARGFTDLGWSARAATAGWALERPGYSAVFVEVDDNGVVSVVADDGRLRLLPLCANLAAIEQEPLKLQLEAWDALEGELVAVHVGRAADLGDPDRETGWSFGGSTTLFACSPWGIDSEERMARLLHGWLNRCAVPQYPPVVRIRALPEFPLGWRWLRYRGEHLVMLRAPEADERAAAQAWASEQARTLELHAQQAKRARQAFAVAPQRAVGEFQRFIDHAEGLLAGMRGCPVCGGEGVVEPRPAKAPDGADATWWAECTNCGSGWGLRPCTGCGARYRALEAQVGLDLLQAAAGSDPRDWPDKVLGRDVWAQPCRSGAGGQFRCPACAWCAVSDCVKCGRAPLVTEVDT